MIVLTPKQQKILVFIRRFIEEKSYPPTIRDIVRGCGISSTSVADYNLTRLEETGFLRRQREISRGIELLDNPPNKKSAATVPVIGQIAAGTPIPVPTSDAWSTVEASDLLEVPGSLVRGKEEVYALKVKGHSMVEDLIDDGDIVIMQNKRTVENGETAAVWLKNEKTATLKKVYMEGQRVRLQPANSLMKPFYSTADNVEIQGKVIAVIRQLT
jgi:repressor LexA